MAFPVVYLFPEGHVLAKAPAEAGIQGGLLDPIGGFAGPAPGVAQTIALDVQAEIQPLGSLEQAVQGWPGAGGCDNRFTLRCSLGLGGHWPEGVCA